MESLNSYQNALQNMVYDPQEKELVRRLDARIIPLLILSLICVMWVTNIKRTGPGY